MPILNGTHPTERIIMDKNKELHELLGLCWHEWVRNIGHDAEDLMCDKCWRYPSEVGENPDYAADPRLVLREMMRCKDWSRFHMRIGSRERTVIDPDGIAWVINSEIRIDLVLNTTGKLRDLAIEWLKNNKGNGGV